jgi:hypothetical protein
MGAVFAFAASTSDISAAQPEAVAGGMRTTFAVAAVLLVAALAMGRRAARLARSAEAGRERGPRPNRTSRAPAPAA